MGLGQVVVSYCSHIQNGQVVVSYRSHIQNRQGQVMVSYNSRIENGAWASGGKLS